MHRPALAAVAALLFLGAGGAIAADAPLLLQKPTLSRTSIVFSFAGDLWTVGREGGEARRLTSGTGRETDPYFSPDGSMVAFTGEYDGNVDVYVVPAAGGIPRRLTWHPGADEVAGFSPDGKTILFRSSQNSHQFFTRLFTVPVDGGPPSELPLPVAVQGSLSPDGKRLAYVPINQWQRAWKRYRGGQTTPIWIANLADSSVELIPRPNSNDSCPMWLGAKVYFLSDRDGSVSLYAYDPQTKQAQQAVKNDGLDFKSASAGPDAIVYEQFGALFLFDPASGRAKPVPVTVAGDFPEVRPHFAKVAKVLRAPSLSPSGARVAFEARGEILTVPAEKGDIRDLTRTPGAADRDPAWSPDGQKLAWFSDESGEYALHIRDQNGLGDVRSIALGAPPSFFYSPRFSPDGKKIAYTDKRLNIWYVDVDKGGPPVKVDTDGYDRPDRAAEPVWSPDSRWLAYSKVLPSQMSAIYVYGLEARAATQVTDGMSDALFPAWDASGKYLYFAASTDLGPGAAWLDMSGINRPVSRSVYAIVLRKDLPSPVVPESDEEKKPGEEDKDKKADASKEAKTAKDTKKDDKARAEEKKEPPPKVTIDFDRISQRTVGLPIPAANYLALLAGKEGTLFLLEAPHVLPIEGPPTQTVQRFELKTRKVVKLVEGVSTFRLATNGEKLLYQQGEGWFVAGTAEPAKAGDGGLKVADAEVFVDPRAEWRQMYRETWRIERDFFYDPGLHGLDLLAMQKKYEPWVQGLASRADLNDLFEEMLGEMTVGHMFVGGGDGPEPPKVKGGLLGADFAIENGRYRFTRVFDGEGWNPNLRAPLTQPAVDVAAGEYLLAVNGRDLVPPESVYAPFQATAGKSVAIRVGPNADGKGSREVTVVPVEEDGSLRHLAWIEGNRRKVEELSKGRLAYVYLPDTGSGGYTSFNRYFFAQVGKEGAILDERFNGGGLLADYIIDLLRRPAMSYVATREGADLASPAASIYGPKVMIINEMAGSGGDAMPWYFRKEGIGKLVGKRTWGGLVGIWGYPQLVDGGSVTSPRGAIYGLAGDWEVENVGIAPDVEVEMDPKAWRQGHDLQLEKAVEVALEELGRNPLPKAKRPAYPNYHKQP
jgi:tricorn protease